MNADKELDVSVPARAGFAALTCVICYSFLFIVPGNLLPGLGRELGSMFTLIGGVMTALAGWLAWTISCRAEAQLLPRVLRGAGLGGVVAFAASALTGPLLYTTKPNHGVLVGLYLAAPLGALAGAVLAAMNRARFRRQRPR